MDVLAPVALVLVGITALVVGCRALLKQRRSAASSSLRSQTGQGSAQIAGVPHPHYVRPPLLLAFELRAIDLREDQSPETVRAAIQACTAELGCPTAPLHDEAQRTAILELCEKALAEWKATDQSAFDANLILGSLALNHSFALGDLGRYEEAAGAATKAAGALRGSADALSDAGTRVGRRWLAVAAEVYAAFIAGKITMTRTAAALESAVTAAQALLAEAEEDRAVDASGELHGLVATLLTRRAMATNESGGSPEQARQLASTARSFAFGVPTRRFALEPQARLAPLTDVAIVAGRDCITHGENGFTAHGALFHDIAMLTRTEAPTDEVFLDLTASWQMAHDGFAQAPSAENGNLLLRTANALHILSTQFGDHETVGTILDTSMKMVGDAWPSGGISDGVRVRLGGLMCNRAMVASVLADYEGAVAMTAQAEHLLSAPMQEQDPGLSATAQQFLYNTQQSLEFYRSIQENGGSRVTLVVQGSPGVSMSAPPVVDATPFDPCGIPQNVIEGPTDTFMSAVEERLQGDPDNPALRALSGLARFRNAWQNQTGVMAQIDRRELHFAIQALQSSILIDRSPTNPAHGLRPRALAARAHLYLQTLDVLSQILNRDPEAPQETAGHWNQAMFERCMGMVTHSVATATAAREHHEFSKEEFEYILCWLRDQDALAHDIVDELLPLVTGEDATADGLEVAIQVAAARNARDGAKAYWARLRDMDANLATGLRDELPWLAE